MEKILFAGYIDPGTGYVFSSIVPAVFGVILTFLVTVVTLLRKFIFRHRVISATILVIAVIIGVLIMKSNYLSRYLKTPPKPKVLILGFDGMDPQILRDGFEHNLFPHLQKLKEKGTFSELATTMPPQSPVAWASFITGMNPAKHHVYDFIKRDPKTYALELVYSKNTQNLIRVPTFWERLSSHNIPVDVLFLPDTYPPTQLNGVMLSGMGIPDVTGTEGTFTFYSSKMNATPAGFRGKFITLDNTDTQTTGIPGPKYAYFKETKVAEVPLTLRRQKDGIEIVLENKTIFVKNETFSDWIPLEFRIDFFTKVRGMVKFYIKSSSPDIELYITPINFDPLSPVFPISYPHDFSNTTAKKLGPYATLGLPQDTWALEQDAIDEDAFLQQVEDTLAERKRIYFDRLKTFRSGTFIGYFGMTDTVSHMFWRYKEKAGSPHKDAIIHYYQLMDEIVGATMKLLKDTDTIIVMSDHGFAPFEYEMNVNSWLRDNGYLTLKGNAKEGAELFDTVDWSKTKAYAAGYNGIYINKIQREGMGSVTDSESLSLIGEIVTKLTAYRNPLNSAPVVKHLYTRKDLHISDDDELSPDIFIGFMRSIRSSWSTAAGGTPIETVQERKSKWSGDHLFDPSEVPGVLLTNKRLNAIRKSPAIIDILPSVLSIYGITKDQEIDGVNVF